MVFIIFGIVLVISVAQISARPMEGDEIRNVRYNIPKVITSGLTIIINGSLTQDTTIETLTAILADKEDNSDNDCSIVFNIKRQILEVSPASTPDSQIMENVPQLYPAFSLKIIVRSDKDGNDIFGVTINGMQDALNCRVNKLENIGYIVIKEGVENVKNMLFEFSS